MKKISALMFMFGLASLLSGADVTFIAHRGEAKDAPENTMSAFRLAWERGVDGIELDVRLTADGEVVVIHDGDTARIAADEAKLYVEQSTLDQLRELDVGSRFKKDFAGEKIPTLEEVLNALPPGKSKLYIEIKGKNVQINSMLCNLIETANPDPNRIVFISYNADHLRQMKRLLPMCRTLLLSNLEWQPSISTTRPKPAEIIEAALACEADGVSLPYKVFWSADFLRPFYNAGLEVHAWSIYNRSAAAKAIELGALSITCDRPNSLKKELGK